MNTHNALVPIDDVAARRSAAANKAWATRRAQGWSPVARSNAVRIDPDDLEECELPDGTEPTGTIMAPEDVDNSLDALRADTSRRLSNSARYNALIEKRKLLHKALMLVRKDQTKNDSKERLVAALAGRSAITDGLLDEARQIETIFAD
jgi:hypothetical protein